jgi:hypothetical protein
MSIEFGYCHCGCGEKTSLSTATRPKIGWVKGQPAMYCKGHHFRKVHRNIESIQQKCAMEPMSGCWIWTGDSTTRGYGMMSHSDGVKGHKEYVHRVTYALTFGEIADGLQALHRCDNPSCCNPHHLFLGTQQDNMDDMLIKGRRPRGAQSTSSKLTAEQVAYIRSSKKTGSDLCQELRISTGQISRIRNNKAWAIPQGV